MVKILIFAVIAFIFAIPLILLNFTYLNLGFFSGMTYYLFYFSACVFFIFFSVVFFIISFFNKEEKIKTILKLSATVSSVLIVMLVINITIFMLHDKSEFIIGANYNKFSSIKWQKADYYGSEREYLLKDLVKNILPHKNVNEVIKLLGDPDTIISSDIWYLNRIINGNEEFQIKEKDTNGNLKPSGYINKDSLYQSQVMKNSTIYYILGPAFIDHASLFITFDEYGIFEKYRKGIT